MLQGTPPFKQLANNTLSWKFNEGRGDWGYPHTVDMTVYRKKDIQEVLLKLPYNNPNTLEGNWASCAPRTLTGLCYSQACIVNCPLNIVQSVWANRNTNACSPEELLALFMQGYKLDIEPLQQIMNKAPHMDYRPTFIER